MHLYEVPLKVIGTANGLVNNCDTGKTDEYGIYFFAFFGSGLVSLFKTVSAGTMRYSFL